MSCTQKFCDRNTVNRFIVAVIHGSFPSSDANLLHGYMQWNLYFGTLLLVPGGKQSLLTSQASENSGLTMRQYLEPCEV